MADAPLADVTVLDGRVDVLEVDVDFLTVTVFIPPFLLMGT